MIAIKNNVPSIMMRMIKINILRNVRGTMGKLCRLISDYKYDDEDD
jgi:hypothetical protein